MFTAKKKPDIENAADAKQPGDKKEDSKTMNLSKLPAAQAAANPLVAKKLKKAGTFPPKK